jgi:hypothetical protein
VPGRDDVKPGYAEKTAKFSVKKRCEIPEKGSTIGRSVLRDRVSPYTSVASDCVSADRFVVAQLTTAELFAFWSQIGAM